MYLTLKNAQCFGIHKFLEYQIDASKVGLQIGWIMFVVITRVDALGMVNRESQDEILE